MELHAKNPQYPLLALTALAVLTVTVAQAGSNLKDPWVSTPELVSHGKALFQAQCAACHGPEGKGNGPAAAVLNPPPRNFSVTTGWKNGRKVSMIFKTLKEGLPGSAMASFGTLPADDRWALTHYVISLNPTAPEQDAPEDFKKAGVDTSGNGVEAIEKSISVDLAIERISTPETESGAHLYQPLSVEMDEQMGGGARVYSSRCVQCHGLKGEGGIKVKNLGVIPVAFVTTHPFSSDKTMVTQEAFDHVVIQGFSGDLMPGNGQLSGGELHELYLFVKSLPNGR
ncbi:c-type cytochrome [Bdellovibrionota bacterium FG-1]